MSMPLRHRSHFLVAGTTLLALSLGRAAHAQSLRGSRASIERMYRRARAERLSFFQTPASVRRAVDAGRLVRLDPGERFELHEVSYPFVRPAVRTFVQRLASQYRVACDEPLIVTSAVRPATRQPANSTGHSVHPTGMAVDLRKPQRGTCLRWLRATLLELEDAGLLEATEEHWPAHFHVAVFPTPYTRHVTMRERAAHREQVADGGGDAASYVVRPGDSLWSIARRHDTTVEAIQRANELRDAALTPGQELRIP